MAQNIVKMATLKESFRYEKLAINTLESINAVLQFKQGDAPAAAAALLMQNLKVVSLKSKIENLKENRDEISKIKYPYVLTKKSKDDDYMACTMRRCFSKEAKLGTVIDAIEENIKIIH